MITIYECPVCGSTVNAPDKTSAEYYQRLLDLTCCEAGVRIGNVYSNHNGDHIARVRGKRI